jgi:hypothetical protein
MRHSWPRLLLLLFFVVAKPLAGQNAHDPASLKDYSRQQLIACLDAPEKCHAHQLYEIEGELDARLPHMSTRDLVNCYSNWHICGESGPWIISDVLSRRGRTTAVIRQYGSSKDPAIRHGIELLAYDSSSRVAADFMQDAFARRLNDGDDLYWPAMYVAKRCDAAALRHLDPGPHSRSIADNFSVSSTQFASTAELFGKCHYRPAIPYLVAIGLHAASLNLVGASEDSLRRFYPGAPEFHSLSAEQHYFCERANHDGFHVKCLDD